MLKILRYGFAAIVLIASAILVVWQGSGRPNFYPDPEQTFVYFAISLLIFLLMVTLGFMLVRIVVKLWIDRRSDRPGSRIRTKLVIGALALSLMPVFFMVVFSQYVMSRTLKVWFMAPNEHIMNDIRAISLAVDQQTRGKALSEAQLLASMPQTALQFENSEAPAPWLDMFCKAHGIAAATILPNGSMQAVARFKAAARSETPLVSAMAPVTRDGQTVGAVFVDESVPINFANQLRDVSRDIDSFHELYDQRQRAKTDFTLILALIAMFILFVAGWLAQFLARQISGPISALVRAAEEVSKGNLSYRVNEKGIDELAQLVGGFNRMTADLEANRSELESRRRFTEAILESIPTGIISVDSSGRVQRVNKALHAIFPDSAARAVSRLDELFSHDDAAEIRYLMNRARRTGLATQELEAKTGDRTLHLAVTVAAIDPARNFRGPGSSGFVVVIEDTSDLLRAQKTAAWSEVARRVAHEIRNPLTPITLSAERILRQAGRVTLPVAFAELLKECAGTILDETASVKRLVDEFSQFSRLPAARPVVCDLNDVVITGMNVFEGRLEGIALGMELAPLLPPVSIDPEQFKRVVVNLVDNAAEAMQDSPLRLLNVMTRVGSQETVELVIEDSGCGVTQDEKEKLFLPYFSTKGRGTGLGLAIVSHILAEHGARVRVEDNKPCGARFTVEIPVAAVEEQKVPAETVSANG